MSKAMESAERVLLEWRSGERTVARLTAEGEAFVVQLGANIWEIVFPHPTRPTSHRGPRVTRVTELVWLAFLVGGFTGLGLGLVLSWGIWGW